MPQPQTYRVTLSDGRTFNVTSEGGPPSEADVLARLGGNTSSQLENLPEVPPQTVMHGLATAVEPAWNAVKSLASALPIPEAVGGSGIIGGPKKLLKGLAQAQWNEYMKSKEAGDKGRVGEVIAHAAAAALPVVGPWAANYAEQVGNELGTGDYVGAAGTTLGNAALLAAPKVVEGASKLARGGARYAMRQAVKPAEALADRYRTTPPKIVDTLLKEGVNVTPGGVDKLSQLLTATNDELTAKLAASDATISKARVLDRVQEAGQDALKSEVNPQGSLKAIEKVANQFIEHPEYPGDTPLSVSEAQNLKTGTYRQIGASYGKSKPGTIAAQKALARGLKEEIAAAVPEASALNARESSLMAAGETMGRAVSKSANADPLGLLFAAHNPELFLAGLINRQPLFKSLIANGSWKMADALAKVPKGTVRGAVATLTAQPVPAPEPE